MKVKRQEGLGLKRETYQAKIVIFYTNVQHKDWTKEFLIWSNGFLLCSLNSLRNITKFEIKFVILWNFRDFYFMSLFFRLEGLI